VPYVQVGNGSFVDVDNRKRVEVGPGGATVSLNFVNVEIQEFSRVVFDEVLHQTLIIDPSLKGTVTVRTPEPVSRDTAIEIVRQAVQSSGASLTQSGGVYRITAGSATKGGNRLGDTVRIIPVRFITAEEAKSALSSFGQKGVEVSANAQGRFITLSGAPADLDNVEQIVATLDVDQLQGMSFGLLPLREASAIPVASELNQMFGKANDPRSFKVIPITRMNAVLVIASHPRALNEARRWVANLDRADRDGRKIYVYPVQNRRATDVAKILASIIDVNKPTSQESNSSPVAPQLTPAFGGSAPPRGPNTMPSGDSAFTSAMPPARSEQAPDLNGPGRDARTQGPRINADISTNSVVVSASNEEWRVIEAALRRLDIMPPQVLIEATIAEITLNNDLRYGVRAYFGKGAQTLALGDDSGALNPVFPGFNYSFGIPNARVILNALEQVTKVQVISSPALTVLDNQTAKLQVGDQVPIVTRSSQSVLTPDAPLINDIEMKDTGVILMVTPRVNASGLVILDIMQEVSDVVPTTTSNLNSPTIRQRRVNSSVAVHSGEEIVLGGLMSASKTKTDGGVPLLMDVPILGEAFKSKAENTKDRTELVVMLRPTVMTSGLDIRNVTDEIKSRMAALMRPSRR
jgi:general secretion pathway protein D